MSRCGRGGGGGGMKCVIAWRGRPVRGACGGCVGVIMHVSVFR